jgi:hypothetical protein
LKELRRDDRRSGVEGENCAKSAAALQGTTLREWVLKAIEEKLKRAK